MPETPTAVDTRLEDAASDPSAFLLMMIGTLYKSPQMYVRRLGELDALLYFTHFLWAHIGGQREHYLRMGGWSFHELEGYDELKQLVKSDLSEHSQALEFAPIVNFWRQVDARIGIDPVA